MSNGGFDSRWLGPVIRRIVLGRWSQASFDDSRDDCSDRFVTPLGTIVALIQILRSAAKPRYDRAWLLQNNS